MKIISVENLKIPEIKVIRFARFKDARGYTAEPFRKSDIVKTGIWNESVNILQTLQSYSKSGVIRGMHFQWNPVIGKLVRTVKGRMVAMELDIRKNSPTYGKIILHDMPESSSEDYNEWIFVPPGFANGNFCTEDTILEYLYTGEYAGVGNEASISPLSKDIDWSLADGQLKKEFSKLSLNPIISDRDKNGITLKEWSKREESDHFKY